MEKTQNTIYSLKEDEVKEAIRRYLVDKLGTKDKFDIKDIKINANVDNDYQAYDFGAELTIVNTEQIKL